jgi:hypothetical protein
MKKHTLDKIAKLCESRNDLLISKEYHYKKHIEYLCGVCKEFHKSLLSNYHRGYRSCASGKKIVWNLEKARAYFAQYDCELLDDWFDKTTDKHNFRCRCGREDVIDLHHFRRHKRCGRCGKTRKLTIEEAKSNIRSVGGELLATEWIKNNSNYDFICVCGKPYRCRYSNFMSGKRCCRGTGGYNSSKPSFLYLLKYNNLFKVGIYNKGTKRIKDHANYGWKQIDEIGPLNGNSIMSIETVIFQMFKKNCVPTGKEAGLEKFDGYSECWSANDLYVTSIDDLWNKL